jgi:hypothetical protein
MTDVVRTFSEHQESVMPVYLVDTPILPEGFTVPLLQMRASAGFSDDNKD